MDSIECDIKNGKDVNSGRLYTFAKTLPLIMKIKQYEDIINKSLLPERKSLTEEQVLEIQEKVLGLHRKPKS